MLVCVKLSVGVGVLDMLAVVLGVGEGVRDGVTEHVLVPVGVAVGALEDDLLGDSVGVLDGVAVAVGVHEGVLLGVGVLDGVVVPVGVFASPVTLPMITLDSTHDSTTTHYTSKDKTRGSIHDCPWLQMTTRDQAVRPTPYTVTGHKQSNTLPALPPPTHTKA